VTVRPKPALWRHGARRLAGYLIKRRSDKIQTGSSDDRAAVRLHFKH
jgi:hypothetical protein